MPATTPTQFRLTDAERARLDELGRLYGTPERPLSMSDVIRRLIWHQCPAETATVKHSANSSTRG